MDKNTLLDVRIEAATLENSVELYHWFNSEKEISTWGGPGFKYPMSETDFIAVLRTAEIDSYWLVDAEGEKLGFGQFYPRLNRYHLGRLVVSPHQRGKGLGKALVRSLLELAPQKIQLQGGKEEASLFVFRDNSAAVKCYQSLGFVKKTYPGPIPGDLDGCDYLVKVMN